MTQKQQWQSLNPTRLRRLDKPWISPSRRPDEFSFSSYYEWDWKSQAKVRMYTILIPNITSNKQILSFWLSKEARKSLLIPIRDGVKKGIELSTMKAVLLWFHRKWLQKSSKIGCIHFHQGGVSQTPNDYFLLLHLLPSYPTLLPTNKTPT